MLREVMLERRANQDEFFLRLLRRKLSAATVVFQEYLGSQVATINSRVDLTIDRELLDSRVLVHSGEDAYPGLSLPITTPRGLALIGLTAGETITIERSDHRTETISLDAVSYRPEADRRDRLYRRQSFSDVETTIGVGSLLSP
jgi:regulator of nucleoside diphosphate kinase